MGGSRAAEVVEFERKRARAEPRRIAVALNSLALVCQAQGKLAEAEASLREALATFRDAVAKGELGEMINLAIVLHHLADVLREEKAFEEARSLAEESVAMYRRRPELSRTEKQHALNVLAALMIDMGASGESEAVFQEVLQDLRARVPADDPQLAGALIEMAFALVAVGKYAEAEPLARECLGIREAKAPDDWRTFNTRSMLGGCLLGQKKSAEAEPLLLSGYEGLKKCEASIPAIGKPRIKEAVQRLVQLFENTNRPDEAAEWKRKLEEFDQAGTNHLAPSLQTKTRP